MKLLVAVDGSPEADDALAFATDLVDGTGGSLTLVHSVDPDVYETDAAGPVEGLADADRHYVLESVADAEQRGLTVLDEAAARAERLGYDAATELLYGDPVATVPEYADAEEFDLVVVGHRSRAEWTERLLGSVAKSIVERATVPVTVVR